MRNVRISAAGLLCVLGLLLCSGSAWASWAKIKRTGMLRVATEGTFKPFNYSENGTLTGFEVELANAIAKKLGLKAEWSTHPFDALLGGLARHEYELVAASHAITPERAKTIEFINPHYCTGATFVTREGGPTTLKGLTGKIVGVTVGTTYNDRLRAMNRFKEIKINKDDAEATQKLIDGEIDAWITDRFVAESTVKARKEAKLDPGGVLFAEMIAMAVPKDERELRDKVNGALAALMKDGTYLKLSQKYFDRDISCQKGPGHRPRANALSD